MNYACSAAIGAVSGLRSMTVPAILSQADDHHVIDIKRSPFSWLSSHRTAQIAAILSGGELIADKLPFSPDRTGAPMLVARFIAGAICGAAVVTTRERNDRIAGGLIGGMAAVAASFVGLPYRTHVKLS